MKRGLSWYAMLLLVVLLLGGALGFQGNMIKRFYLDPEKYRDALYVPSQGYLRTIAVGYDQFFADFFWLRMIQGFAAGWSRPETAEQMYSYFKGITELDPLFLEVYSFAFMPLGEEGHRNDLVKEVVMDSFVNIPGNWKIPSDGATYFGIMAQQPDEDLAKFYLRLTLLSPSHPEYMNNWMAYFDFKEGRFQAAYEKYMTDYVQSFGNGVNDLTAVRRVHLLRNLDGWYKDVIHTQAQDWKNKNNVLPSFEQLKAAGVFKGVKLPDWHAIRLFLDRLEQAGKVPPLSDEDARNLVDGYIKTWDNFPDECPFDYQTPGYSGYFVFASPGKEGVFEIANTKELLTRYQLWSNEFDDRLAGYKKDHGGACPTDPAELVPELKAFKDPLGGEIVVDPKTCTLSFTKVPDLKKFYLIAQ